MRLSTTKTSRPCKVIYTRWAPPLPGVAGKSNPATLTLHRLVIKRSCCDWPSSALIVALQPLRKCSCCIQNPHPCSLAPAACCSPCCCPKAIQASQTVCFSLPTWHTARVTCHSFPKHTNINAVQVSACEEAAALYAHVASSTRQQRKHCIIATRGLYSQAVDSKS